MKKLLNFFRKPVAQSQIETETAELAESYQDNAGWIYPRLASQLLSTELRQKYLGVLWQQVSMDKKMFAVLYQQPIESYAEMVQLLPASESHHHAHIGGMLDHGLEVIAFAAKLRQSYVLPPNAAPEDQSKQRDAWTAAAIYFALVHDIGKVVVDIEITLKDGSRWFAWNGIPSQPYKFKYIKNRDYHLHPVLGAFLANQLIPKSAFDWLGQYPEVISALMYAMSGHNEKAGLLSEIVQKADQHSVTLSLGGDVNKLVQRPANSLSKQLVLALRYLLEQKIKLNTPKGPADGWFTEDGLWLVSKTAADNIRTYLLGLGISVPKDNPKLFDEMQSLGIVEKSPSGGAIWNCRIQADSGWTPPNTFTLLKFKPEVAWENVNDRPPFFAGKIKVEDKIKENDVSEILQEPAGNQIPRIQQESLNATVAENESTNSDMSESENDFTAKLLDMFEKNDEQQAEENVGSIANFEIMPAEPIHTNDQKTIEVVQSHNPIQAMEVEEKIGNSGQQFVDWLKNGISQNRFAISKNTARLHIVEDCLFLVSPAIFEQFLQEVGQPYDKASITQLQYSFQSLGLHTQRNIVINGKVDSVNFWRCTVAGPRKTSYLTGYLIKDKSLFLGDRVLLNNLCLTLEKEEK